MTMRALAMYGLAATLAACATASEPDAPVNRRLSGDAAEPLSAVTATPTPPPPVPVRVPGPSAASFVGRSIEDLELLLGPPALVRREGATEFRRYDVNADCRAFVVAQPDGAILTVDTGGGVQGAPAPAFEDCTATERFTGS